MAFDLNKTLSVIKGGLVDPEATWKAFLEENPSWQQTVLVLTGPLLVANVLLTLIFSRLVGGYSAYGYQPSWFTGLMIALLAGAIGIGITTFVFNFMAGTFRGTPNFSRAFAAVSLAAIPAWVASAVASIIPFLGYLLALAGGILSLVYMYRIMPLALNVPQDKRVVHYVASLVLIIVVNMIIGSVLGMGGAGYALRSGEYSDGADVGGNIASSGVIGEVARQTDLMTAAGEDRYDPPANGKLDEDQVEDYIKVLQKTRAIQAEYAERMERLSNDMKARETAGETPSLADLGKVISGAGSMMGANNAEMEVVKTGGGNWAEHQWVKQQLRAAHIQQGDGDAAIAHNYKLYQKYQEVLKDG